MKIYIGACQLGLIAVDEKGEFAGSEMFENDPEKTAEKLLDFEQGKEIEETRKFREKFAGNEIIIQQPNKAADYIENNFMQMAKEKFKDLAEMNDFLKKVSIALSRRKISRLQKRDKLIIQAISAVNDLDKILNLMTERAREWHGLHFPELNIVDHEKFAANVAEFGNREKFPDFKGSMGMEFDEKDSGMIKEYGKRLSELYGMRKNMEKYLDEVCEKEMPNVRALLGTLLAGRLLALAGGLEKLAKMPSSTIQLLGSEKSLFKFLKAKGKGDARCPKFGILFTHPDVSGSRKDIQGKVARLLSSKLTIAARADFYTKENKGKQLKEEYTKKFKEIAARNQPPQ